MKVDEKKQFLDKITMQARCKTAIKNCNAKRLEQSRLFKKSFETPLKIPYTSIGALLGVKKEHNLNIPELSMFLIWLCKAKWDTGESMASLDLAHRRTTFNPVFSIFSVNWSTAVFEGAQTKIGPPCCFTSWYTIVADVTVFPVPGGPKIKIIQVHIGIIRRTQTFFTWPILNLTG